MKRIYTRDVQQIGALIGVLIDVLIGVLVGVLVGVLIGELISWVQQEIAISCGVGLTSCFKYQI